MVAQGTLRVSHTVRHAHTWGCGPSSKWSDVRSGCGQGVVHIPLTFANVFFSTLVARLLLWILITRGRWIDLVVGVKVFSFFFKVRSWSNSFSAQRGCESIDLCCCSRESVVLLAIWNCSLKFLVFTHVCYVISFLACFLLYFDSVLCHVFVHILSSFPPVWFLNSHVTSIGCQCNFYARLDQHLPQFYAGRRGVQELLCQNKTVSFPSPHSSPLHHLMTHLLPLHENLLMNP